MNKRWRNVGLYTLLAIVVVSLATAFFDKQPQKTPNWTYSQFIERVMDRKIEKVKISADRTIAQVKDPAGNGWVNINLPPYDQDLVKILTKNGVDISVMPPNDEGFLFKALSSLFFPVLLLVGLFFLLRRAQNGPGSQAMNFGKSKAQRADGTANPSHLWGCGGD